MPLYYQLNTFQFALNHLAFTMPTRAVETDALIKSRWTPKAGFQFPFDSTDGGFVTHLSTDELGTKVIFLWAKIHKHWLKHLRKMLVSYTVIERGSQTLGKGFLVVAAAFDPKLGLGTSCYRTVAANKDVYLRGLREHTEQLETYRRFLSLEGEVLPMLWTSDLRLWADLRNIAAGAKDPNELHGGVYR